MNTMRIFLMMGIFVACIGIAYIADAPYRKQVQEFTKKCHEQHGVVVQEHDTKNLLCFPADF
jgi:hypothetical protein